MMEKNLKVIRTQDAVGHILCHDITQIIPGEKKGPVFKKGHVVTSEDIPVLLSVGKENLYVWEKTENLLHENEAAEILREICMGNSSLMEYGEASEGKIDIKSAVTGLLKIRSENLFNVNSLGEMMIATIHGNTVVHPGDKICGTRIIPLAIEKEKMLEAKKIAGDQPILSILPINPAKVGVVVTGSEIEKGLIKDSFTPVLEKKFKEFGCTVMGKKITGDSTEKIVSAIHEFSSEGANLILCTGGMSVDPDDRTPLAIRQSGAKIVTYGAPVLPGAMFLLSYLDSPRGEIPVLGLPGCVMFAGRTVFDLVLPRILAGEKLEKNDIVSYGEGGLCLGCKVCHYPDCGFGK